jgi:hypothetical protein
MPWAGTNTPALFLCFILLVTRPGELLRMPFRRSSVGLGPMGGVFSGSCVVTSRNPLIHDGATNATWLGRFDPKTVPPYRSGALAAELGGTLATANFRECLFV